MKYHVIVEEENGDFFTEVVVEADSEDAARNAAIAIVEADPESRDWQRFTGSLNFDSFEITGVDEADEDVQAETLP